MPIAQSDLRLYASLNMPENDVTVSGGGIDTATKVEFSDIAATDTVQALSSSASDITQTITVTGRDATGAIVTAGPTTLTGVTAVLISTQTFERILKIVMSAAAIGTVTIRRTTGSTTIATLEPAGGAIPANITRVRRMFYDSASAAAITNRYEKVFLRQGHATLTLNSSLVQLVSETPAGGPSKNMLIALAVSKGDTNSVTNRTTAPVGTVLSNAAGTGSGGIFVDDGIDLTVPSATPGQMLAGEHIGVWVNLVLGASAAPSKGTGSIRLAGITV